MTVLVIGLCLCVGESFATPLLPDLFSWENESLGYMHGGTFDLESEPGRVLYRFNAAIPNRGDGAFEVFEVTHPNQTQDVYQNIYDSEGGFTQVLMASFTDVEDPPFGHLHLEGLAKYSLREVTNGNGVGPIVATHLKTSHGLVDSVSYDLSLPGAPIVKVYSSVQANPLGVSVGWADLYSKSIPKQRIDVTDVLSGQYWLEVVVDPFNYVQETDETNNNTRILVDLTIPDPVFLAGDLDGDGLVTTADAPLFIQALVNRTAYDAAFPLLDADIIGDINQNGTFDLGDIADFSAMFGGSASANTVPEPTTLSLAVVLLLGIGIRQRRRV